MIIMSLKPETSESTICSIVSDRTVEVEQISEPGEEWRPIGSSKIELVSNLGRIKCYPSVKEVNGKRQLFYGGLVSQIPDYRGFLFANVPESGYIDVSLTVADAFIENPTGIRIIRHKNGNLRDNSAENLEWATRFKSLKRMICRADTGEQFESVADAAKVSGISSASIYRSLKTGKPVKGVIWVRKG